MNSTTDWYDVEQLPGAGRKIGTPHTQTPSYVFLIEGSETTVVVDAGYGVGDLAGLLATAVETDARMVLTHWHWDHIGNAHQFDDVAIHPTEQSDGRVTIDVLSDEFVRRPSQFVADMREENRPFPDDFDPDSFELPPATDVGVVEDGDEIDLGDRSIEVVSLPGHSPGQVGLLDRRDGILYGGDVIHTDDGLYLHFQDSDLGACRRTFERLRRLRDDGAFDVLATSHNEPYEGDDLRLIDDLSEGLDAIAAGEAEYEVVETRWGTARKYEIGESTVQTRMDPET